jgi:branched-subunit amino acid ABC-type transport system permease component
VTESVISVVWSPAFANVVVFAVLIAVVTWKPSGVFGKEGQ